MTFSDQMKDLVEKLATDQERAILTGINELVKKGALVLERGPFTLVEDSSQKIVVKQTVRLLLKDQEYIERLEKENKLLKEQVQRLKDWLAVDLREAGI